MIGTATRRINVMNKYTLNNLTSRELGTLIEGLRLVINKWLQEKANQFECHPLWSEVKPHSTESEKKQMAMIQKLEETLIHFEAYGIPHSARDLYRTMCPGFNFELDKEQLLAYAVESGVATLDENGNYWYSEEYWDMRASGEKPKPDVDEFLKRWNAKKEEVE